MYVIYKDPDFGRDIIHSPNLLNEGLIVTSAKLTQEINKAGSLEFTIPPTHPEYDNLPLMRTIVSVEVDEEEIFRGRILNVETDFYKNKKIFCEGELAFLNDVVTEPYDYEDGNGPGEGIYPWDFFWIMMQTYEEYANYDRDIHRGAFNASFANDSWFLKNEEYSNVYTELMEKFVEARGGYFYISGHYKSGANYYSELSYSETFDNHSDQVIQFGANMIDLDEYIDATDIYTMIIPLGKEKDDGTRVDISSINSGDYDGKMLANFDGINLYGQICKVVIFDEIDDPEELMEIGQKTVDNAVNTATTITISAVDLHHLNVNTDRIKLADNVRVVSVPHGIDTDFLCSKVVLDLLDPSNDEYTLGLNLATLTERQARTARMSGHAYTISTGSTSYTTFYSYRTATDQQISALNARVAALEGK